jgi:hypothetical protein
MERYRCAGSAGHPPWVKRPLILRPDFNGVKPSMATQADTRDGARILQLEELTSMSFPSFSHADASILTLAPLPEGAGLFCV